MQCIFFRIMWSYFISLYIYIYTSFYILHEIHANNVIILLCNCMYNLNKKAKLTCLSIIKLGIVEDSVIKENCPLLLEMHARVIERMFAFFSLSCDVSRTLSRCFSSTREGLMSFTLYERLNPQENDIFLKESP